LADRGEKPAVERERGEDGPKRIGKIVRWNKVREGVPFSTPRRRAVSRLFIGFKSGPIFRPAFVKPILTLSRETPFSPVNSRVHSIHLSRFFKFFLTILSCKSQFETAFLSQTTPDIQPALTEEQLVAIKKRIETAWASLFYPPPDDCAKEIMHEYLHDSLRQKAFEFLASISLGQKEIYDMLNEQHALQQRVDELGRKISRIEGIDCVFRAMSPTHSDSCRPPVPMHVAH
jgi:hypothetical protein